MTLIKLGDRYINLDNVTSISPVNEQFAGKAGVLQIEYIGRASEDYGAEWVEGEEAEALRWYLANTAVDGDAMSDETRAALIRTHADRIAERVRRAGELFGGCRVCGFDHPTTSCPEVAAERRRQEEQAHNG